MTTRSKKAAKASSVEAVEAALPESGLHVWGSVYDPVTRLGDGGWAREEGGGVRKGRRSSVICSHGRTGDVTRRGVTISRLQTMDKRNKGAAVAGGPAPEDPTGRLWGRRLSDEGRKEFGDYDALADAVTADEYDDLIRDILVSTAVGEMWAHVSALCYLE